jgi:FkbM family methyltransferase
MNYLARYPTRVTLTNPNPNSVLPPQDTADMLRTVLEDHPYAKPRKGVIHVGAHRCEEQGLYESLGIPGSNILWIDGNDDLCAQYPHVVNAVISDVDDATVEFIITNNDAMSSSILEMKEHKEEHPDCLVSKRVSKRTVTLDTLLTRQQLRHDAYDLLAMDIQGAELLALKGATLILPHVNCVLTEINRKELYADCVLLTDLDAHLAKHDFVRVATMTTRHGWGDAVYIRRGPEFEAFMSKKMATVEVDSGLGNRLFQLSFLYAFAKKTGVRPFLARDMIKGCGTHFSDMRRYEPFYKLFDGKIIPKMDANSARNCHVVQEPSSAPCVFVDYGLDAIPTRSDLTIFKGFFQSSKYFEPCQEEIRTYFNSVLAEVSDTEQIERTHPELAQESTYFIHVRGRDHIERSNSMHRLENINRYYEACVDEVVSRDSSAFFLVFTDDMSYLRTLNIVNRLRRFRIVRRSELESLYMMTRCAAGGVCCNSTFSWWGAFLNTNPSKAVYMPKPFLNGVSDEDMYFPGVRRMSVPNHAGEGLFDHIVSTRLVGSELVIVVVTNRKDKTNIHAVLIDGQKVDAERFGEELHQDIFNDVFVIRTKKPSWRSVRGLSFSLSLNGHSKRMYVERTEAPSRKHALVAMTMFKDDQQLIASYVAYYRKLGVDHFYMYVNDVQPASGFPAFDDVTYVQWNHPYMVDAKHHAQIGAITDFLYWAKHTANYALFNDLDEYVFWNPVHVTLKQFVTQNGFSCYGVLNRFVYLKDKSQEVEPTDDMFELIEGGCIEKTAIVYPWTKRSKCIVKLKDVAFMGVHSVISPAEGLALCVLGYETAGIHHVCNMKGRLHTSVSKDFLKKI